MGATKIAEKKQKVEWWCHILKFWILFRYYKKVTRLEKSPTVFWNFWLTSNGQYFVVFLDYLNFSIIISSKIGKKMHTTNSKIYHFRPWDKDRYMSPDIIAVNNLLKEDKIWNAVKHHMESYHTSQVKWTWNFFLYSLIIFRIPIPFDFYFDKRIWMEVLHGSKVHLF